MDKYEQLIGLVKSLEPDFIKFYNRNNKTAGIRVRKGMQDIRSLAKEIRDDIQKVKSELK